MAAWTSCGSLQLQAGQVALAERLDIVGGDLVAEAARAGVDHDGDAARLQPEQAGGRGIVDLLHRLHLDEVVARAQRAQLGGAALAGPGAEGARRVERQAAARLDELQVARPRRRSGARSRRRRRRGRAGTPSCSAGRWPRGVRPVGMRCRMAWPTGSATAANSAAGMELASRRTPQLMS